MQKHVFHASSPGFFSNDLTRLLPSLASADLLHAEVITAVLAALRARGWAVWRRRWRRAVGTPSACAIADLSG